MNKTTPDTLAALLASPLTEHSFTRPPVVMRATDSRASYIAQTLYAGFGDMLVASVTGNDGLKTGYPTPTIEQAKAIHTELMRRWNSHQGLVDALGDAADEVDNYIANCEKMEAPEEMVHLRRVAEENRKALANARA